MRNLLVAQSGGPTSAINATVAGVISTAFTSPKIDKVLGAVNGIQGVLDENFIDLGESIRSARDLELLTRTPAAALGTCRLKLKEEAQFEKIIENFRKNDIHYFVYIGGNDSMDTVDQLSKYCIDHNIDDIVVVGAPKTIDNDLVGTDHCPGFGSAAKYLATTFQELERDCNAYPNQTVTIVEVMGRDAGWLTAATALSRLNGSTGPDLIYLCERAFDTEKFLDDIRTVMAKHHAVLIAISEGIKNEEGRYISEAVQTGGAVDAFGHGRINGSAQVLGDLVTEKIGCKVRSIELSLMQRCAAHIVSATDIEESRMLGMTACQCALEGKTAMMAAVIRTNDDPYEVRFDTIPVSTVANQVKSVPDEFINEEGNDVTQELIDYLRPLIRGEYSVMFKNGIPLHMLSLY